jgi:hypothetical protein
MNSPAALLAELDKKYGRTHTVSDWKAVGRKSMETPELLTDDDVLLLEGFDGPESGQRARARRDAALRVATPTPAPIKKTTQAPSPQTGLTAHDVDDISDAIVETVKSAADVLRDRIVILEQTVGGLNARLAAMESAFGELSSRPTVKYGGPWMPGAYQPGTLITRTGGLWLCTSPTSDTPGQSSAWRLIVKKGQA